MWEINTLVVRPLPVLQYAIWKNWNWPADETTRRKSKVQLLSVNKVLSTTQSEMSGFL